MTVPVQTEDIAVIPTMTEARADVDKREVARRNIAKALEALVEELIQRTDLKDNTRIALECIHQAFGKRTYYNTRELHLIQFVLAIHFPHLAEVIDAMNTIEKMLE